MPKHPLAEVFGFPTDNLSHDADRYRRDRLCPFNNKVPNCTKDKVENPLGVCSVFEGDNAVVTCPIRFRQDWLITGDAAAFFFPSGTTWTSLTEIRLNDKNGKSAGNIDVVLVAFDVAGQITDFGALEVQAVYISGNIRTAFAHYMSDPAAHANMDWTRHKYYPRPDYLSSSRKRLAPQLIYKGGILHAWGKKQAVAVDSSFFATLPPLNEVDAAEAELAWLVNDLRYDAAQNLRRLVRNRIVYTRFNAALDTITQSEPGNMHEFVEQLQHRLDERRVGVDSDGNGAPPDAPSLNDVLEG